MRGPNDDTELELESLDTSEAPKLRPRPPGGKALLRQVQILESAGFARLAYDKVEEAVSQEELPQTTETIAKFSALPVLDEAPPRRAGGRRRRAAPEPLEEAVAGAINAGEANVALIGGLYLRAGEDIAETVPGQLQWRSLGPWTIPNGQTYGASRVNVSGRVSAILVDPADPRRLLVSAANGGVWESKDRGASWAPRTDNAATLAVGALAFDPADPQIVYCGTGEGDWWSWLGAGILRSTNGGADWSVWCSVPFVGQGFFDLEVDPANSQRLLAGTTGGLFRSTDGGKTWAARRATTTWSLGFSPPGAAQGEILAACRDGLWQSTDNGVNWTRVALPGAPAAFDRLAVAIAPSNPGVAYAWGSSGGRAGLWQRASGAWSSVAPPPGVNTGQAWYDWFLAVSPDNENQIYCAAIEVHRGELVSGAWSWKNITSKGLVGDSIHPDQHAIGFEPGKPDTIYIGNDGGLFRSDDRGEHWVHCNNGLMISEFEYLAQDFGKADWLIGGTQDNGTARYTGSATWEHVADGDGGDCGVDRSNPDVVYHTYYGMSPERSTRRGEWGSWRSIRPPTPAGEESLFYPPFECSATGGDTIAIGGDALYLSRSGGSAWKRLVYPSAARSSAIALPNSDSAYVGTTDGRLFRSEWQSTTWSSLVALTAPRGGAYVSDIYVDPLNPQLIWVTHRTVGGGRVWRSDDGGASWTNCSSGGLPALPMNAIEIDPADKKRLWVAADLGVYQTLDNGATWTNFSNGLPNAYIGDLLFHPQARLLRAATRSRGVWEIPVDGVLEQSLSGVQFTGRLGPRQTRRFFSRDWPANWHVYWTVMPLTPKPGAAQVSWTVQVERTNPETVTYWISVKNLTAASVEIEGRYVIFSQ